MGRESGRESGRERGGGRERGREEENNKQEVNKTTDRDTRASTVVGGAPVSCVGGERLPASYVNYLLVNGGIVMPSLVSSGVNPRRGKAERVFVFLACRAATAAVSTYLSNSQPSPLPPPPPLDQVLCEIMILARGTECLMYPNSLRI
jgi:hypothetical protein